MVKKIGQNTVLLLISQIIARGIGFFYFIFLARNLGVTSLGIYSFTLAFVNNFVSAADFGIEKLVLRDISRMPEKSSFYLSRLLPLRIFLCFVSYVLIIVTGLFLGFSVQKIFYLLIFALFLFPNNIIYLLVSFQNAKEKMQYMAIANISTIVLTALSGVLFIFYKFNFNWIFISFFVGYSLFLFLFTLYLKLKKNELHIKPVIDFSFIKSVISQSWVFALITIISVVYLRMSIILVDMIKGSYFTGLYSSVFKFIEASLVFPQAFTLALFPISSRLFLEDKKRLKGIYFKGLVLLLLFSLIPFLILQFFSGTIVRYAYGGEYLPAAKTFSILGISVILFFVNSLAGNIIQSSYKVKQYLPLILLNLVITILLMFILIPKYSIEGAAWGVVIGELFGFVINNLLVIRILKEKE